jgi:hypothetical protein
MAGAAGRRYHLQPSFPTHEVAFDPPQMTVGAETPVGERLINSGIWIQYIARLQADLAVTEMEEDQKRFFQQTYVAEQQRYFAYLTGSAVVAQPAAMPTQGATSVRANLPERFTGNAERLEIFLDNMQTYFNVTSTPQDKQAGALRLNLSDAVVQTLTQTNRANPHFWDNIQLITASLKEFYQAPNKQTAAQTKLKHLKMLGYKLNKYFNTFITLCGESGYNPDDQAHKAAFHLGLNNLVTRGGLRSQVLSMVHDNESTLKQLYLRADEYMQAEHGVSYETKHCPADNDEHKNSKGNNQSADNTAAGWKTVSRKRKQYNNTSSPSDRDNVSPAYNPRGNRGGRSGINTNSSGRGGGRKNNSNTYDPNLRCTRCDRKGHAKETCNAKYRNNTTTVLPYNTTANVKNGTWAADGNYPESVSVNMLAPVGVVAQGSAQEARTAEQPTTTATEATTAHSVEECPELGASNISFGVQSAAFSLMDVDWCAPHKPKSNNKRSTK